MLLLFTAMWFASLAPALAAAPHAGELVLLPPPPLASNNGSLIDPFAEPPPDPPAAPSPPPAASAEAAPAAPPSPPATEAAPPLPQPAAELPALEQALRQRPLTLPRRRESRAFHFERMPAHEALGRIAADRHVSVAIIGPLEALTGSVDERASFEEAVTGLLPPSWVLRKSGDTYQIERESPHHQLPSVSLERLRQSGRSHQP